MPLIATSANLSNEPAVACYTELNTVLRNTIPVCPPRCKEDEPQGTLPSTIVRLDDEVITIIRHGTTSEQELTSFTRKRQSTYCTHNTIYRTIRRRFVFATSCNTGASYSTGRGSVL